MATRGTCAAFVQREKLTRVACRKEFPFVNKGAVTQVIVFGSKRWLLYPPLFNHP